MSNNITEALLNSSKEKLPAVLEYIARHIINRECSLFLGAGMSLNSNLPTWHQLLKPCAEALDIQDAPNLNLFSLAQYYVNNRSESELRRIINEQISAIAKSTDLHKTLVSIGFKSIWTTNYDQLVEDSLKECGIAYNSIASDADIKNVSHEGKVNVYKINGDISNRDTMVLTQRDVERYERTHKLFLTFLKKELVSNTFLFFGYSFKDRIILNCLCDIREYLNSDFSHTTHFAIMVVNGEENKDTIYFAEDLKLRYGIECIFISKDDLEPVIGLLLKSIRNKKVFISGAYYVLSKREEHFAEVLSECLVRKLYDNKYRISTGIGKRLGAFITGYANQFLISSGITDTNKYLSMRPFPFHLKLDSNTKIRYRTIMEHDCYASIFMFGRSETTAKEGSYSETGHYSKGVYQEFQIAKSLGHIIIPLGTTGYEARVIWKEVKQSINEYPYLSKKIDILGKEKDPELLSNTVISILDSCSKHSSIN